MYFFHVRNILGQNSSEHTVKTDQSFLVAMFLINTYSTLGGSTIFQNLTDTPENHHVVLLVLQNLKSKISEK